MLSQVGAGSHPRMRRSGSPLPVPSVSQRVYGLLVRPCESDSPTILVAHPRDFTIAGHVVAALLVPLVAVVDVAVLILESLAALSAGAGAGVGVGALEAVGLHLRSLSRCLHVTNSDTPVKVCQVL